MAKKIKTIIKLNLPAGEATPAPPVGTSLGQHGLPIMDFVKTYNEKTKEQKGNIVPVVITVYEDRTYTFETKLAPVSAMIKKELGIDKGSGEPGKTSVATLTQAQVKKIAEGKLPDLNTNDVEAATRIVQGTARSMGIAIER